jgi:hypothetical protein
MTLSSNISEDIQVKLDDKYSNIDFFRNQIIEVDSKKDQYDNAIKIIDVDLISKIDEVNSTLYAVKEAYQDRHDAGCRTDLFWRTVGFSTGDISLGTFDTYELKCTKLTLSKYNSIVSTTPTPIPTPIPTPVAIGDTSYGNVLSYFNGTDPIEYPLNTKFGWIPDNLHGIKYYNEPITKDIGNTIIGSFIGTIGIASSTLIIMIPASSGVGNLFQVNQLVTSSKNGIFPQSTNKIVGMGTELVDLSEVYVGIGTTVVDTIILNDLVLSEVSAPESNGSFVTFTVIDDPSNISNVSEYAIPFESNPFSPQTIGIMNSSNIGIGRNIVYDNSGNSSNTQSWRPENAISGIEDIPDVVEPSVGAGKIYYKDGFTQIPINPITNSPAVEGDIIFSTFLSTVYRTLPNCPAQESNLSNLINIRNAKEAEFSSNISEFSNILNVSSILRTERDNYNSQIWGMRQSMGGEIDEIDRYNSLQSYIKSSTITNILD